LLVNGKEKENKDWAWKVVSERGRRRKN
jgi:hypothetical protein